jgi:hypothetical protein
VLKTPAALLPRPVLKTAQGLGLVVLVPGLALALPEPLPAQRLPALLQLAD